MDKIICETKGCGQQIVRNYALALSITDEDEIGNVLRYWQWLCPRCGQEYWELKRDVVIIDPKR